MDATYSRAPLDYLQARLLVRVLRGPRNAGRSTLYDLKGVSVGNISKKPTLTTHKSAVSSTFRFW